MRKIIRIVPVFLLAALLAGLSGCNKKQLRQPPTTGNSGGGGGLNLNKAELMEVAREMGKVIGREVAREINANTVKVQLTSEPEVAAFYRKHPKAFRIATPADIPANLEWQSGEGLKEFASPNAKRGGTFYDYMADFPRTLRYVGPDANGAFRSYILDYNVVTLIEEHPNEDAKFFPGLARQWAIDADKKTVFFRLDPDARYSDGEPVRVTDFFFHFYFMRSKHLKAPWYADFYGKKHFTNITLYDEETLSISFWKAKPDLLDRVNIRPVPEHFYGALDEQFIEDFQFQMEPTTGPYVVKPENIEEDVSVTLTRLPDWWANDKKFFRNRFNPDAQKITVIRDPTKQFEVFRKGELDWYGLGLPKDWYDKLPDDDDRVASGYLQKFQFYNEVPRPTWAVRLNSHHALLRDKNIRLGLHHAMNFAEVIKREFRGDYQRMNSVADGYGGRSHPTQKAREFSVSKARALFKQAGFNKAGGDGILENDKGQKLIFTFTTPYKRLQNVLVILKEEAEKCGVQLNLEILDRTAAWKKVDEKKHEIMLGALNTSVELYPRFFEPYHSYNAYQEPKEQLYNADGTLKRGLTPKATTNNFTMTADQEIDALIDTYRETEDLAEITRLSHQLIGKLHGHGGYIPGWVRPWYRLGSWRWLKWPDDFNVKLSRRPTEFHVHWIDTAAREETLEAMKSGQKTFKPVIKVYDQYKRD
jgi:microcin C transport system substrate-binding protein